MVIFEKKKFASPECREKKVCFAGNLLAPPINIKWPLPNDNGVLYYVLK